MTISRISLVKQLILCALALMMSYVSTAQRVVFSPVWTAQSQFAGYYVAQEKGFYDELGLDVVIAHPSVSNNTINRLKLGESDIVVLSCLEALKELATGLPLVNVLQTSQNNSLMLVSHDYIHSLDDLRGKRVGRWRAGFYEAAMAFDKQHNMNIQWIDFNTNINLYISKAIDATLAMSFNEYFQILASGADISKDVTFYFSDFGYNIPEDGLYVTRSYLSKNRATVEKFVEASKRGWLWAREHPDEALNIVIKYMKDEHISTNVAHQKWMLKEILRLQVDNATGKIPFELSSEALKSASQILMESGYLAREITEKEFCRYGKSK